MAFRLFTFEKILNSWIRDKFDGDWYAIATNGIDNDESCTHENRFYGKILLDFIEISIKPMKSYEILSNGSIAKHFVLKSGSI